MWETILIGLGCVVVGYVLKKLGDAWYKKSLKTEKTKMDDYGALALKWIGEALIFAVGSLIKRKKK
jgi:uncharacterized membrane-anchored protein YhcB (DUF1043 family)